MFMKAFRYTAMQPRPFTNTHTHTHQYHVEETYGISKYGMMRKCHQSSLGFSHVQIPLIAKK
jgi:hypothetical protein